MIGTVVRVKCSPPGVPVTNAACLLTAPSSAQLSIVSVSLMALQSPSEVTGRVLFGVLQAVVPALCMNVCIVGFNQVCDVEIDKARLHNAPQVWHHAA